MASLSDSPGVRLLYEDDVVEAVAAFLRQHGYDIQALATSKMRGPDIVAAQRTAPQREVYIEAKGEGSSDPTSARFGKPFNSGQVFDHVAKAVLTALRIVAANADDHMRAAVAFPRNRLHLKEVELVRPALHGSGIGVFWVDERRTVIFDSPWDL